MTINNRERRAFVVSPHQDDAVISIGNYLKSYGGVDVANVFTVSDSHMLPGVSDDPRVVSAIRRAEDAAVTERYGFTFTDAGFSDSELRGVAWNDYWADIDTELLGAVQEHLMQAMGAPRSDTDIFVPAAFGLHPDHVLAAMAGVCAAKRLGHGAIFLYADQPYYSEPNLTRLRAHDQLNHSTRTTLPFDELKKERMLALYPSQLTPGRVRKLAQLTAEYVWPLPAVIPEMAERYNRQGGAFIEQPWRTAVERLYRADAMIDVRASNEYGEAVEMSVFRDTHIIDESSVSFIRPVGAGYYDYCAPEGGVCDGQALQGIVTSLEGLGDALWLSGIREDSPLYVAAAQRHAKDAILFAGEPSMVADCAPGGFDEWVAGKSQAIRSKIRRNDRKLEQLAQERAGSVAVGTVDKATLGAFLRLQAARAANSDGKLDAFEQDAEYVDVLNRLTKGGLLSAVTVAADGETVGVMLFHEDQLNATISMINQGFDPRYAEFGLGFIMQQKLMRHAHEREMKYVDYLKGDEPYKRDFTNRKLAVYKYAERLGGLSDEQWNAVKGYIKSYVE